MSCETCSSLRMFSVMYLYNLVHHHLCFYRISGLRVWRVGTPFYLHWNFLPPTQNPNFTPILALYGGKNRTSWYTKCNQNGQTSCDHQRWYSNNLSRMNDDFPPMTAKSIKPKKVRCVTFTCRCCWFLVSDFPRNSYIPLVHIYIYIRRMRMRSSTRWLSPWRNYALVLTDFGCNRRMSSSLTVNQFEGPFSKVGRQIPTVTDS